MSNRVFQFLFVLVLTLSLSVSPLPYIHQKEAMADSQSDQPLLSFAVFSDTHVMAEWSRDHRFTAEQFSQALRDIKPLHPNFLVINGDLTNGYPDDYRLLLHLYREQADWPLFVTMGNHDYYYQWVNPKWDDHSAQQQFRSFFHLPTLYYDRYIHGIHLIWLSPEQYRPMQKQIGEAAWLSEAQIKWFEQTLLRDTKTPAFVFLHQPLDGTVGQDNSRVSVVQHQRLLEIARRHPQVIWFSGHSHITVDAGSEAVQKYGIHFFGTSSVFLPEDPVFTPGRHLKGYRANPLKSESCFVTVYRDRIEIRARRHHSHTFGRTVRIKLQRPLLARFKNNSLP